MRETRSKRKIKVEDTSVEDIIIKKEKIEPIFNNIKHSNTIAKDEKPDISEFEKQIEDKAVVKTETYNSAIDRESSSSEGVDWERILSRIKDFRSKNQAPVDTIGCHAIGTRGPTPAINRYRTLVALILSSQTRDEMTSSAVDNLNAALSGGLSPTSLVAATDDTIKHAIKLVGFANTKVKYLRQTSRLLLERHNGDVPSQLAELLDLPGVGPKMAYLALQSCWDVNIGIGVDTHVFRISHKLGFVPPSSKTPEDTRKRLQSLLPQSEWPSINPLLVGFGQILCTAKKPDCNNCPVNDLCISSTAIIKPHTKIKNAKKMS
ncbi:Endonuclease III-like protein 1 [Smittium culicis]|uniref:Endonuclease III homolog n=1 Tax=Smittium culicis TaxID=133412 RepID=A0A1R1XV21_9FUNG|nr:Endonuclease III-like protein 1 [Smittium culicis]